MVEGSLRVHTARRDGDGSGAGEDSPRRDEAEERDERECDNIGGLSFLLSCFCFRGVGVGIDFGWVCSRVSLVRCREESTEANWRRAFSKTEREKTHCFGEHGGQTFFVFS